MTYKLEPGLNRISSHAVLILPERVDMSLPGAAKEFAYGFKKLDKRRGEIVMQQSMKKVLRIVTQGGNLHLLRS